MFQILGTGLGLVFRTSVVFLSFEFESRILIGDPFDPELSLEQSLDCTVCSGSRSSLRGLLYGRLIG